MAGSTGQSGTPRGAGADCTAASVTPTFQAGVSTASAGDPGLRGAGR